MKIGKHLSQSFTTNQGVRQGCILSPLLFNIFISDLPGILDLAENEPAKIDDSNKLSCILWADDLVMFSETEAGLSKMLSKLSEFAKSNGLIINADKSKCMIFNKMGRHIRCNLPCGDLTIASVREYKYLGFLVTPSGEVTTGINDLRARASYALVQLRRKLGDHFRKNVAISMYLFDSLIKPILLYCSDFWGVLKLNKRRPIELISPTSSHIEVVHMKFLKQLLGVQKQTSNVGVLLETGRLPLMVYAIKNVIKNWHRISNKKCNSLTYLSYVSIIENDIDWFGNISTYVNQIGCGNILWEETQSPENLVFKRSADIFYQNSFAEITDESSKLRTYSIFKLEAKREPYLAKVTNIADRIAFSKFRLSNHKLMIEKGRHEQLPIDMRKCSFCHCVEDERHFLLDCKIFAHPRRKFLREAQESIPNNLDHLSKEMLFKILLTNEEIAPRLAKYIRQAMEIREFLIENHRQYA